MMSLLTIIFKQAVILFKLTSRIFLRDDDDRDDDADDDDDEAVYRKIQGGNFELWCRCCLCCRCRRCPGHTTFGFPRLTYLPISVARSVEPMLFDTVFGPMDRFCGLRKR